MEALTAMTRTSVLVSLVSSLAITLLAPAAATPAEHEFDVNARVVLDAYQAAVDTHLAGVLTTLRTLAATEEARAGDWGRMRGLLAVLAEGEKERAAVWYAKPDGMYFTVEKGATGESLRDRAYFPALLEGRDVVGALVISKSTGKRSVIVAAPVLVDGKVSGAVGVSVDATQLAASLDRAIRLPADTVFYALDAQGRTALHRAGELIFAFPSDVGSPTLRDAVGTMLGRPEGVVHYEYSGSDKTAVFKHSALTGWVLVLGKSYPMAAGARRDTQ